MPFEPCGPEPLDAVINVRLTAAEKARLRDDADLAALESTYGHIGYETLRVSAVTGQGIDALRKTLRGRCSLMVGLYSGRGAEGMSKVGIELLLDIECLLLGSDVPPTSARTVAPASPF